MTAETVIAILLALLLMLVGYVALTNNSQASQVSNTLDKINQRMGEMDTQSRITQQRLADHLDWASRNFTPSGNRRWLHVRRR